MRFAVLLQPLLFLFLTRGITASVYSCEEVRYRLINSSFTQNTRYACVVTQEGFSNWDQLEKVYTQVGIYYTSLHDIATSSGGCIENVKMEGPWQVVADAGLTLNCAQEFSLILTSELPKFILPHREEERYRLDSRRVITAPQTGMWMHKRRCVGGGSITLSTGAGVGEDEDVFRMQSWTCDSLPDWLFSFDSVITIDVDPPVEFIMECSSLLELDAMVMATPGDHLAVLTSGKSDDLQNMEGVERAAFVLIGEWESHEVTVDMQLNFDSANTDGSIVIQKSWEGKGENYYNGTYSETFTTNFFEVRYEPKRKQPAEIWNSQDNVVIEMTIDSKAPSTGPTTAPVTSVSAYCDCSVSPSGSPINWTYSGIWLDVVVVIDTSEAMGEKAIDQASALTESLLSSGGKDLLSTDTAAPFYTRIGVIAMAETAKVLYNLNMTKADKVQGKAVIIKGLKQINIVDAFESALTMLNEGSNPARSSTRRVIYYMTDSDLNNSPNTFNGFKTSGIIIVNNFLQPGELERASLKKLSSNGYFFSKNDDYTTSLQAFCKANCFCKSAKDSYGGPDPAVQAVGGCYQTAPDARVPFNKAKSACATDGGILATIHDDEKGQFMQQVMSVSKSDYFWLGYSKSDDGVWRWEDQSTDAYTSWGAGEPSGAAVAKCAYVDKSTSSLPWGAGNCQVGFPYACEYQPCSVGYKNC